MAKKLTDKQKAFCDEYLVDLNATQAAIRAGYSEKTARSAGQRLLTNVDIAEKIQTSQAKRASRLELTADRVVLELMRIGYTDITEIAEFGPNGVRLKSSDEIDENAIAAVSEVVETNSMSEEGPYCSSLRVKMHSKAQALSLLGKHLGIFVDKLALTDPTGEKQAELRSMPDDELKAKLAEAKARLEALS